MPDDFVFCSNCGTQAPQGATFCQKCGASLNPQVPVVPPGVSAVAAPTPAGSRGYGGFWIRFLAIIIDSIIISIAIRIVFSITGIGHFGRVWMSDGDFSELAVHRGIFPAMIGVQVVINWLYEAFMTSSSWQATVGKKILNLKVTDEAGNRISFARATGRHFAKIVSAMILGIGFIMAGFTDRKRALHDMIAGTLVVKG